MPFFEVSGDTAQVLIPGNVGSVGLSRRLGLDGYFVAVDPHFFLHTPSDPPHNGWVAEQTQPSRPDRFQLKSGANPETILVPIIAYGEEEVKLGPPC